MGAYTNILLGNQRNVNNYAWLYGSRWIEIGIEGYLRFGRWENPINKDRQRN